MVVVGIVVTMVAVLSGLIAWYDPYTLANLRGMFQLQLTRIFLLILIWIGGILLVSVSMISARICFQLGHKSVTKKEL